MKSFIKLIALSLVLASNAFAGNTPYFYCSQTGAQNAVYFESNEQTPFGKTATVYVGSRKYVAVQLQSLSTGDTENFVYCLNDSKEDTDCSYATEGQLLLNLEFNTQADPITLIHASTEGGFPTQRVNLTCKDGSMVWN